MKVSILGLVDPTLFQFIKDLGKAILQMNRSTCPSLQTFVSHMNNTSLSNHDKQGLWIVIVSSRFGNETNNFTAMWCLDVGLAKLFVLTCAHLHINPFDNRTRSPMKSSTKIKPLDSLCRLSFLAYSHVVQHFIPMSNTIG